MKTKILGLIMSVLLLGPAAASANGTIQKTNVDESKNIHTSRDYLKMDKNWHERMKQKEQKLLGLVGVYTPQNKKEWAKVISERNSMREKWLSPQFAKKRAKWQKEKMAKIDALQKQYADGKLNKEEFMKKVHGSKALGNHNTYHELKEAVKNKNNKKAALLLNRLLVQYKQQNEIMKAAMNSL